MIVVRFHLERTKNNHNQVQSIFFVNQTSKLNETALCKENDEITFSHPHTERKRHGKQSKLNVFQFMNQTLCKECDDNTTSHNLCFSFISVVKVLSSFKQVACGGCACFFHFASGVSITICKHSHSHIYSICTSFQIQILRHGTECKETRNWAHSNVDNLQHGFLCQLCCRYCYCYCRCRCRCYCAYVFLLYPQIVLMFRRVPYSWIYQTTHSKHTSDKSGSGKNSFRIHALVMSVHIHPHPHPQTRAKYHLHCMYYFMQNERHMKISSTFSFHQTEYPNEIFLLPSEMHSN